MNRRFLPGIALVFLLSAVVPGFPASFTGGGVTLQLDDRARVVGMAVGEKALKVAPEPLVALCDVSTGEFVPGTVVGGDAATGWQLDFGAARARATLMVAPKGERLQFTCDLQGENLPARGMLLRFAFPFDAIGWQWYQDMQTAKPIAAAEVCENVVPLRAYADLPEWRDQPALRMGYTNRNFCTVVAGPVGLCVAVPLDRPATFRTAYNGPQKRLEMVYDFALSPDTRRPNAVSFAFDLYACDPAWGMRSALQRYYRIYPEFFKVYPRVQGQWMAFARLSEIDNANEFLFGLQEGAPEPEYDDKLGVLSATYFTHAGMFANIPGYNPEKDPLPPYETLVAAMEAQFERTTKLKGLYKQVGLHTAEGKLDVRKAAVYGHLLAQFTLDPELTYGEWTLKRALEQTEQIKRTKGADLDGFYYDGLSTGLDYNPEHFKTADAPCLWDPEAKKPFLNNFFASVEFARAAAELLRPKGQITMMNGALESSFYVAPWLDLFGAETGVRIPRERFNYIRTIIYHKPFLTLLKGNYEKVLGRPEVELYMKRCLAYGVYPGFFDWSPSGLGPGGQYHSHPRYYERDRDLHRKYLPLCRALALAGWEPVTYARSSAPAVFVERFGPTQEGIVWWTLLNEDSRPHETTLTMDLGALRLDAQSVRAVDLVSGTAIPLAIQGQTAVARLSVPADGVLAIQVAKPSAAAGWRVAQSIETLDRGIQMRAIDAEKPAIPVHWRYSGQITRESEGTDHCVVLVADGKRDTTIRQWAMLFQPEPRGVKLRVRAAATGVQDGDDARIRCQLAWVTRSFTHYENVTFDLPGGTYDWRDFEFPIRCEQPLRAIQLFASLGGKSAEARLRIASISLSDAVRDEYVVDGGFDEWYEPQPKELRPRVEQQVSEIREGLVQLGKSTGQLSTPAARQALSSVLGKCRSLREMIAREKAENGCRRVLRDLETVEGHLGPVALIAYGVAPPVMSGPSTAVPGDTVRLSFPVKAAAGVPVRRSFAAPGATVVARPGGAALTLPRDAEIGSVIEVKGALHVGKPGAEAVVTSSHRVAVIAPLELALENHGFDPEAGTARLRATVRNHRAQSARVELAAQAPSGWKVTGAGPLSVPASAERSVELRLAPEGASAAGMVDVNVTATAGADRCSARAFLLHIPKEANLLKNAGFEEGNTGWSARAEQIDQTVARSGKASLKLENRVVGQTQVGQSVTLNQKAPCPILVQVSSRALNVSGEKGKGYALYVDIYYTDGTPLYGQTFDFQTGTTEWQFGQVYIEPAKPVRVVNVYLLLRGKSGTVWFDDVAVMEDLRRKGNVAREAQVTVDSSFSGYDSSPVNDGVTVGEGLHWTKEAWASAEEARPHFIELRFKEPRSIARALVYWSLDGGVARTSREIAVEIPEGDGWKRVALVKPGAPEPVTEIRFAQPVQSERFRFVQPMGAGPQGRPNLMWVREVELFPESTAR
jgi:hypothetical protein